MLAYSRMGRTSVVFTMCMLGVWFCVGMSGCFCDYRLPYMP